MKPETFGTTGCWRKWRNELTTMTVMHLLKIMLKANGRCGVPEGGVVSPLLSNIYLNEVDRMLERAREVNTQWRVHLHRVRAFCRRSGDLVAAQQLQGFVQPVTRPTEALSLPSPHQMTPIFFSTQS